MNKRFACVLAFTLCALVGSSPLNPILGVVHHPDVIFVDHGHHHWSFGQAAGPGLARMTDAA